MATKHSAAATLLQRLCLRSSLPKQPLYWKAEPASGVVATRSGLRLAPGARLSFDTYFNAFWERSWCDAARIVAPRLEVEASGAFELTLVRHAATTGVTPIARLQAQGRIGIDLDVPAQPGARGRIAVTMAAGDAPVEIHGAAWVQQGDGEAPVGLVLAICTFRREAQLARNLAALGADAASLATLARIVVIDQGASALSQRADFMTLPDALQAKLRIFEQKNFGGAGGFGRGLLEALADRAATHVLLMDDDVELEPESIRRAATLFALARQPMAIGGHMLDSLQPTRLYEAGARIDPRNWALRPLMQGHDLARRRALDALLVPPPMQYGGWWFFGLPLAVLRRHGMPLPCFIRGDDVEYGWRLHDAGIPTLSLPGIAIWHEPFYVKQGGWQLYYETRNHLIAAALHGRASRWRLALNGWKRAMLPLLEFRYAHAALARAGLRDFLAGPDVLADPASRHAALTARFAQRPVEYSPHWRVLPHQKLPAEPRSRLGFLITLGRVVLRQAVRPTSPDSQPRLIGPGDVVWFRLRHADAVAIEHPFEAAHEVLRRDRKQFVWGLASTTRLTWRLLRRSGRAQARWREAAPFLTSVAGWCAHLELDHEPGERAHPDARRQARESPLSR